jgi:PPOX class probable F420-dependent enzyme
MTAAVTLDPAARIDRLLSTESTVWLSTVRPDGTPHLVPIWFSWDGERLFIASKPEAVKVRNLRQNRRLMLALGEPDADFDVGLLEATAELPDAPTSELLPAGHLDKYAAQMAELGLSAAEYCETYSQPILLRPTKFLPWHGRSTPASALPSPAPASRSLESVRGWARRLAGTLPVPAARLGLRPTGSAA